MAKSKVAIYTRISQFRQGQGPEQGSPKEPGTERQEEACRSHCLQREWTVSEVYTDLSISAYRNVERPDFERLLAAVESGQLDGVVVWKLDRLVRRMREFVRFWEICQKHGVFLASATEPIDTTEPLGVAVLQIIVAVAEMEAATMSARQTAKHADLARKGLGKGGGTRPFGFDSDRKSHRKAEAKLVREAAEKVVGGDTLRALAMDWKRRGISTVTGADWSTTVLRNMLTSPRIAGLREHLGEIVRDEQGEFVKAEWEAIIDVETYFKLLAILDDPGRDKRGGRPGRKYLLTGGLAICGLCGANLVARPRGDGRPCYVCASGPNFNGCGKIRILAHPFEEAVLTRVYNSLEAVEHAAHRTSATGDDQEELLRALQADKGSLEQLARDYYMDKVIQRDEFLAVKGPLEARVEELEGRLSRLQNTQPFSWTELLTTAVEPEVGLDDAEQVAQWKPVLNGALDKVVVGPAIKGQNFFNPDRVELVWRDEVNRARRDLEEAATEEG